MSAPVSRSSSGRDVLRSLCKAGGELGCSCADQNYQWFDQECKERMAAAFKRMLGVAQGQSDRGALTKLAAECHRAKWQFDLNEDYKPTAKVARAMILKAFDELHRIGDVALKLRDASSVPSTQRDSPLTADDAVATEQEERRRAFGPFPWEGQE